ncbi:AIG2 family protein [Herpetosiphon aurantiacus DSM 785]|uniref:AIG2 family protein n=1 Tax=Herpetosiphon aurantiacus (strain ATCC 23779 / DSM 785 / 114-95) TaxID=316274 RepID=A9AZD3_HERA2|nr:AIG2 family protein [Herpetosiphon aurantiacus DSM 785]
MSDQPAYDTPLPLFVYGTLRTGEYNWQIYLAGKTLSETPAIAHQHQLYANRYPYMIVGEGSVVGTLVEIKPELYQAVMQEIDELEQFRPAGNSWYLRVVRDVQVGERQVLAWMYYAGERVTQHLTDDHHIAHGDWVRWNAEQANHSLE